MHEHDHRPPYRTHAAHTHTLGALEIHFNKKKCQRIPLASITFQLNWFEGIDIASMHRLTNAFAWHSVGETTSRFIWIAGTEKFSSFFPGKLASEGSRCQMNESSIRINWKMISVIAIRLPSPSPSVCRSPCVCAICCDDDDSVSRNKRNKTLIEQKTKIEKEKQKINAKLFCPGNGLCKTHKNINYSKFVIMSNAEPNDAYVNGTRIV